MEYIEPRSKAEPKKKLAKEHFQKALPTQKQATIHMDDDAPAPPKTQRPMPRKHTEEELDRVKLQLEEVNKVCQRDPSRKGNLFRSRPVPQQLAEEAYQALLTTPEDLWALDLRKHSGAFNEHTKCLRLGIQQMPGVHAGHIISQATLNPKLRQVQEKLLEVYNLGTDWACAFSAIHVTRSFQSTRHKDNGNWPLGLSVTFGQFEGGHLAVDIQDTPHARIDGQNVKVIDTHNRLTLVPLTYHGVPSSKVDWGTKTS